MFQLCLLCAWSELGRIFWTCDVYVLCAQSTHTHNRSKICGQTPTTHMKNTIEPLYVISIKYSSSLPDDGSYVIRNMLEYFNVCLLDVCTSII